MNETTNLPSGSITQIISTILNNPPIPDEIHHAQTKLGHASMAGKCARQIWFACNIPRKKQPNPSPIMIIGKLIHDWFDNAITEIGDNKILVKQECDLRPNFNVIGMADFLSSNSVGELKTTKQFAFKYLFSPHVSHILQASIYAYYWRKRYIEIMYLARDTGHFKSFFWPAIGRTYIENEIERISEISQMENAPEKLTWDNLKLNPWSEAITPWQCKYCPFRKECLEIDNEQFFA